MCAQIQKENNDYIYIYIYIPGIAENLMIFNNHEKETAQLRKKETNLELYLVY